MGRQPPRTPLRLVAVLLLGAAGVALIIIGLGGTTGWALIVPGFIAVLVSIPSAYVIQARRDAATEAAQLRAAALRRDALTQTRRRRDRS
jgi:hypothetical protein